MPTSDSRPSTPSAPLAASRLLGWLRRRRTT
ncbi:MAG: MYXO-CTERM sorting domain-containing protein [Armatimonadota bacterium]